MHSNAARRARLGRIRLWVGVLAALGAQGPIESAEYVVADGVGKADAFYAAVEWLASHRKAAVVPIDFARLDAFRDAMREHAPRYVAVVLRPERLDDELARRFLQMSAQVDDDPFVDFSYGFITGTNGAEALALVQRGVHAEMSRRAAELASIGTWGRAKSQIVRGHFALRDKSIPHLAGWLASPETLKNQERDTAFIQEFLPQLQAKSVVLFSGHGYPREVVGGPTWKDLAGLDLTGAVALNIACYTGVTQTWFEEDWRARVLRKRTIPLNESFALAVLRTGVIGYVAYPCFRPAGPELFTDVSALVAEGVSLGDARRRDYDKIVLGFLSYGAKKMELAPVVDGQKLAPPKDMVRERMLEPGAGGILFGDPALVPFASLSNSAPVTVRTACDDRTTRLTVDVEVANEHLFYFCSEPTASWDGKGASAMKAYAKVPLPADYVSGVTIDRLQLGIMKVQSRLIWAIEIDHGQRFIHLKAMFLPPKTLLGNLRAQFQVALTVDSAKAVFLHADPRMTAAEKVQ